MIITFTGGPYRNECECIGGFDALEELISAGYIILDVRSVA